jgi:anthranilate phosphoribosyltransferase
LDGLDEVSTIGKTVIAWLKDGEVSTLETAPEDFGVNPVTPEALHVASPQESAETVFRILHGFCGPDDPRLEIVLVNSAAGIVVGGKAEDFSHGMEIARKVISDGAAYVKLKGLIRASGGEPSKFEELESKYA